MTFFPCCLKYSFILSQYEFTALPRTVKLNWMAWMYSQFFSWTLILFFFPILMANVEPRTFYFLIIFVCRASSTCWSRSWVSCFELWFPSSCGTSTSWEKSPQPATSWGPRSLSSTASARCFLETNKNESRIMMMMIIIALNTSKLRRGHSHEHPLSHNSLTTSAGRNSPETRSFH